jgi:hypothetical protein
MEVLMSALIVEEDKFFELFNAKSLENAWRARPHTEYDLSEHEIVACLKPSKVDWKLRIRLWDLVHKALDPSNEYNQIYTVDIVEGICTSNVLYRQLKHKRYFASFLLSPIEKFTDEVNTMLSITRDKMWQLINNLKPGTKDCTVDRTHANLLIKVHKELVDRKMGATKQLIEMRKIQLNLNTDMPIDDIEAIDNKIREMRPQVELIEAEHGSSQITEDEE